MCVIYAIYEEFKYLFLSEEFKNPWKSAATCNGNYKIISKLSDVNYKIDRLNHHTGHDFEIVHISKLYLYNSSDKLKLSHGEQQTKVKVI